MPFRFIHAADLHLDSPLLGLEAHDGAPVELLRGATRRSFENLVQLAIAERVGFLVIAGDVYDGDWKDYSTGLFFRRQVVRLGEQGIPVFLISGNHDAASVISKRLTTPDNLHVFSTRTVESKRVPGHPAVVHGRGFPNRRVPENLASEYPPAVPDMFNLGLLHTSLTGRPGHEPYAPCCEADLREKGYAYWALGHVHQPEIICKDPYIIYAGNSQGRHIREAGPRGCWLVTVGEDLRVEAVDWHDLDVLRWMQINVDLNGIAAEAEALARVREALRQAAAAAGGRPVAARIVLEGRTPLHGSLHREAERWRAEILAAAQGCGAEVCWVEQIRLATAPIYSVAELAERDALTRVVVETLASTPLDLTVLPSDVQDLFSSLPASLKDEVAREALQEQALIEDVRAIILDALAAHGGQAL